MEEITKEYILSLQNRNEIMRAMAKNREIWDVELSDHLAAVSRRELIEEFGTDQIRVDYFARKKEARHHDGR